MKIQAERDLLPRQRPPSSRADIAPAAAGFDWAALVAQTVHPAKVAIVEALQWVGHPLSALELTALLADAHYGKDLVAYHARALAKLGAIEVAATRRVRGAWENYYYFHVSTRKVGGE